MRIHPFLQASPPDTTQDGALHTAYDSVWAGSEVPTQPPSPLERTMLAEDKLYVVLAVVLIIWLGLVVFLFHTDRRLRRLERSAPPGIPSDT